jgi:hypothetical protein
MGDILNILILLAVAAVAVTLGFGIYSLYRSGGSDADRSRSNKLMRLRVALQALAVVLLCIGMWWKSTNGA